MFSFSDYLKRFKKKYICLEFSKETEDNLRNWAITNGFDLSVNYDGNYQDPEDYKFHVTVFFTSSSHDTIPTEMDIDPFIVKPESFELLGPDKNIPVIKLHLNNPLMAIRMFWANQGYKDNWPSYKPHISLSYAKYDYDLTGLNLPTFPFTINKLKIKNQE